MKTTYCKIMAFLPLLALALLVCTVASAEAASKNCTVKAAVSPDNQSSPEKDPSGNPMKVKLNGSSSTPNGGITYSWSQTSGNAVVLSSTSDSQPTFYTPAVGPGGQDLTFELTVSGCSPVQSDKISTVVHVTNVNNGPSAEVTGSSDTVNEGEVAILNGTSSTDPDNDPLTYSWVQEKGTAVELMGTGPIVTFVAPPELYPGSESLFFHLIVSDGLLSSNPKNVIVTVKSVNLPPVAYISCPASVDERAPVILDGQGSYDPDGGHLKFTWRQLQGTPNIDFPVIDADDATLAFTAPSLTSSKNDMEFALTVTDNGGLAALATCTVRVNDITPPAIAAHGPVSAEATSLAGAVANYDLPATLDNVDGPLLASCEPKSGSQFPMGVTFVTCNAADLAGNPALTTTFAVTVADRIAPTIANVPGHITVEAQSPAGAVVDYSLPSASDTIDGSVSVTCTPASHSTFGLGSTAVNCLSSDNSGNSTSTAFPITVQDTIAPKITAPPDLIVEASGPSTSVTTGTASASDAVGVAAIVSDAPPTFPLGLTIVTWTARDAAGNTSRATQKITVKDRIPPLITAPDVTLDATGPQTPWPTKNASASDAVGVTSLSSNAPATFPVGTTTITWTAKDAADNTGSKTQKITVKLTVPPVGHAPAAGPRLPAALPLKR